VKGEILVRERFPGFADVPADLDPEDNGFTTELTLACVPSGRMTKASHR
jgi:hypothetical protein